jgi:hypothetical protein
MYEGYYESSAEGTPIPTSDGIHVDAREGLYFASIQDLELVAIWETYLESANPVWGLRCAMSSGE